jgi:hypothetical protein
MAAMSWARFWPQTADFTDEGLGAFLPPLGCVHLDTILVEMTCPLGQLRNFFYDEILSSL